jgi:hypothetical protein
LCAALPALCQREIWAPRYRKPRWAPFSPTSPKAPAALSAAYTDVLAAFDHALDQEPLPAVLAGHSQGTFHLMRLLRDRVAGTPLAARIAAAYVIGWPVSLAHDLPAMGLPACSRPDKRAASELAELCRTGRRHMVAAHARFPAGRRPGGTAPSCAPTADRPPHSTGRRRTGTLVPESRWATAAALAACPRAALAAPGARALLARWLADGGAAKMGPLVAPGNNYHVYDIPCSGPICAPMRTGAPPHGNAIAPAGGTMSEAPRITTGALDMRDWLPEGGPARAGPWHADHRHRLPTATGASPRPARPSRAASSAWTRPDHGADHRALDQGHRHRPAAEHGRAEGPRAQSARAYARNLAALGLPILLWDERWSTTSAERGLIEQDMSRAKRKNASTAPPPP